MDVLARGFGTTALLAALLLGVQSATGCPRLDVCAIGASFDDDFVEIRGWNPPDVVDLNGLRRPTAFGSVAHPYRIGRYEVTNCQYAEFLNAVASPAEPYDAALPPDAHNLYLTRHQGVAYEPMAASPHGGIAWCNPARRREGGRCQAMPACPDGGASCFVVKPVFRDRPVVFVNFLDAARFANWLSDGCRDGGETEDGPYPLEDARGRPLPGMEQIQVQRSCDRAAYFVPSEDEWYKAAYHDPATGRYFDFPTGSDRVSCRPPGTAASDAGSANCALAVPAGDTGGPYALGSPRAVTGLTPVGAYGPASRSPHGTLDQGGNAMEWLETGTRFLVGKDPPVEVPARLLRGSAWDRMSVFLMHRQWQGFFVVSDGIFGGNVDFVGFRLGARAGAARPCS